MSHVLEIKPLAGPVRGQVRPPGSKSITNRALVCAALADGKSTLTGALDSEDTRVMIDGLQRLGIAIERHDDGRKLIVQGAGGLVPALEADIFCANSGTTIRFLTAMTTLGHGSFSLDGVGRMRERPIGDLITTLNALGAVVRSENDDDCPPIVVHANGLVGGAAKVRGDISSQFLSGLLMTAPAAQSPIKLIIDGPLVSRPYVTMTLAVMSAFGVHVDGCPDMKSFEINAPQSYHPQAYTIEPDASAASYFWAAAAITGGEVTVHGLSGDSLQGDVRFVRCLEQMGCVVRQDANTMTVTGGQLHGIDVDMNAISDTVQTLGVVAAFADGPTTIRNVGHIRHKETNRIEALATELRKLGVHVTTTDDTLVVRPGPLKGAQIATYDDHRMAMSFAIAGLQLPGVRIENPACVGKTYPQFFDDLRSVTEGPTVST